jgi:hypothetical protein
MKKNYGTTDQRRFTRIFAEVVYFIRDKPHSSVVLFILPHLLVFSLYRSFLGVKTKASRSASPNTSSLRR